MLLASMLCIRAGDEVPVVKRTTSEAQRRVVSVNQTCLYDMSDRYDHAPAQSASARPVRRSDAALQWCRQLGH